MFKKQTAHDADLCPIVSAAQTVGDTWVLLIVRALLESPLRFNRLYENIHSLGAGRKISSRTLAQRLKDLDEAGIVRRSACSDAPTYAEYTLTEKGKALAPIIESLRVYGSTYPQ